MDFAALLIVIELDEFLVCYPDLVYAKKHFGDKFLTHNFKNQEVQTLIKIETISFFTTYLNILLSTIENVTKVVTRYAVYIIVVAVHANKMFKFREGDFMVGNYVLYPIDSTEQSEANKSIYHTGIRSLRNSNETHPASFYALLSNTDSNIAEEPLRQITLNPCYWGLFYCSED